VRIESDKLGQLEVDETTVLTFPQGLLGFDDIRRFALVDAHDSGVYFWLQSVDDPKLAFLTAVPWPFFEDYEFELADADRDALGLRDDSGGADTMVLCLLTIDSGGAITANLLGPLVINCETRVGRQIVLADPDLTTRAPLGAAA